jgi:hypothetical protein
VFCCRVVFFGGAGEIWQRLGGNGSGSRSLLGFGELLVFVFVGMGVDHKSSQIWGIALV